MIRLIFFLAVFGIYAGLARDGVTILIVSPLFIGILISAAKNTSPYVSPEDFVDLIVFLFFVIAPMQSFNGTHFSENGPAKYIQFSHYHLLVAEAIVLLFYVSYSESLRYMRFKYERVGRSTSIVLSDRDVLVFTCLAIISFFGYIEAAGGIENAMAARYDKVQEEVSIFKDLLLASLVVSSLLVCAAFSDVECRNILRRIALLSVLVLLVVALNPFNTSRNNLFGVWFCVFSIFLRGAIPVAWLYILVAFGIFFVMPVVNFTSREGYGLVESMQTFDLVENFRAPFSDAIDTLAFCVMWFQENSFSFGEKTLGLLLFFVPRALWTTKPSLTGLDIGNYLFESGVAGTPNLSFFVGGDFYADFSLLGPALGGLVMASICFYLVFYKPASIQRIQLISFVYASSLPILIRGPFAANVGFYFFQILLLRLFCRIYAR